MQQELALGQAADRGPGRIDVGRATGGPQALQQPVLVALGLQPADDPRARRWTWPCSRGRPGSASPARSPTPNARACLSRVRSGALDGGAAGCGGTNPKTSSKYTSARRLHVPGCARNQLRTRLITSVTTNCRSSSDRCDERDDRARGPWPGHVVRSSGSPRPQAANVGDASSALSRSASFVRSCAGKNVSMSNTPSLRSGGSCTCRISRGRSSVMPACHARSSRLVTRMCSRPAAGRSPPRPGAAGPRWCRRPAGRSRSATRAAPACPRG